MAQLLGNWEFSSAKLLLLDPHNPHTTLDQDMLHAAVAVLAEQVNGQAGQILSRPGGHLSAWTSNDFVTALQDAAAGDTEALQVGLWRQRARPAGSRREPSVDRCWEETFAAVASAGHIHVLQAVQAVRPGMLVRCTGLYIAACASGKAGLSILQWLKSLDQLFPINNPEMLAVAARNGQLATLQWLLQGDSKTWEVTWSNPAECAQLVACTDAWRQLSSSPPQDLHADFGSIALCALAAQMQDLVSLQELTAQYKCPFDQYTGMALAKHGHADALKQLLEGLPSNSAADLLRSEIADTGAQAAAKAGQLETLKWFWDQRAPSEIVQMPLPADDGSPVQGQPKVPGFPSLSFPIYSTSSYRPPDRPEWATHIATAGIDGGHLAILEWLWENSRASLHHPGACLFAAHRQATPILRWLLARSPPCQWEPDFSVYPNPHSRAREVWEALAHHTHLPSPGFLNQIPLEPQACREAAALNNLELMIWLRGQGCPWDARACNVAARAGHLDMLKWLRSQQPPCDWTPHTSLLAAQHDQPDTLRWLLAQGCPPPSRPELASDTCLGILVERQLTLPPAATSRAAALGLL